LNSISEKTELGNSAEIGRSSLLTGYNDVRKEVIGDCVLYHGDCLEILATISDVDVILTDPPFNSGREDIENDSLTDQEWFRFCLRFSLMLNAKNILVEVGKNDLRMRNALDLIHRYRWMITLNYTNAMRQGCVGYSNTGMILWYGEGKCYQRYMDRIDAPLENTKGVFSHPSPKTTAHYKKLIEMFSKELMTIVDPFMGSGTTGVACVKTNRKFIGIELNPKYFDIACERIATAYRTRPRLFDSVKPSEPVQQGLF
jgi:site-specific DNA-methyltransferase (adenine-specific)